MDILTKQDQAVAMEYFAWCLALKKSFAPEQFDLQFPEYIQQMEVPLSPSLHGFRVKMQLTGHTLPLFYKRLAKGTGMGMVFARAFRKAAEVNGIDYDLQ